MPWASPPRRAISPKFQYIRRLAEETGGFRREVRVGSSQKYTISNQFVAEALENGGTATITLREPPGAVRRSASPPISTMAAPRASTSAVTRADAADRPARARLGQPGSSPCPSRRAPAAWYEQAVRLGPREQDGRPDQRRGTGAGHDRTVARRHQQLKCTQGPTGRRGRRGGGGRPDRLRMARNARRQRLALPAADHQRAHRPPS